MAVVAIVLSKPGAIGVLMSITPAVGALNSVCAGVESLVVVWCDDYWFRVMRFFAKYAQVRGIS